MVSQALLDMMRNLIEAGYEELVQEHTGLTSGALGDMPDEDGIETSVDQPTMRKRRAIGFHM